MCTKETDPGRVEVVTSVEDASYISFEEHLDEEFDVASELAFDYEIEMLDDTEIAAEVFFEVTEPII